MRQQYWDSLDLVTLLVIFIMYCIALFIIIIDTDFLVIAIYGFFVIYIM